MRSLLVLLGSTASVAVQRQGNPVDQDSSAARTTLTVGNDAGMPLRDEGELRYVRPDELPSWKIYQDPDHPDLVRQPPFALQDPGKEAFDRLSTGDPVVVECLGKQQAKIEFMMYVAWNVSEPTVTPFIVPVGAENRQDVAVVIVPGGGGRFIAFNSEGTDVALWLNSIGISAFVLKYRSPAEDRLMGGNQVSDVQRAVSLVRQRAPSFQLDPNRIGLYGFSHGANLDMLASAMTRRAYPKMDAVDEVDYTANFLVMVYPGISDLFLEPDTERIKREYHLDTARVPPTFIVAMSDDKCIPLEKVLALYYHVRQSHLPNSPELHVFPDGGHGLSMCLRRGSRFPEQHDVCGWLDAAERFMRHTALGLAPSSSGGAASVGAWHLRLKSAVNALSR